jgi:sugar phosphate isomerase/epimerase
MGGRDAAAVARMIIRDEPPRHLTYCLNIHRGETWAENFAAVEAHALRVRDAVAPGRRFGLGLRLSARAAAALNRPAALARFRKFLDAHDLYVFTLNGFPYGTFHGARVKENVYAPDWRTRERRDYTLALADILAALLPEGCPGSISTVPGSYAPWIRTKRDVEKMCANLADVAAHLARLRETRSVDIALALEPEPDCHVETTAQAIAFLTGPLLSAGAARLRDAHNVAPRHARAVLAAHIGVCLDTAHAAVEFERPQKALCALLAAGVRVPKIQLSAALRARPDAATLRRLREFCDPVYLHQTHVKAGRARARAFPDLPEALEAHARTADKRRRPAAEEWRIHFHVPLFFTRDAGLSSTADLLDARFFKAVRAAAVPHLEIETYTFDVLPPTLRCADVAESIAREYAWVLARL